MGNSVNFCISIKTELSIEDFLKCFSDFKWIKEYGNGGLCMRNSYAYFSINERLNHKDTDTSFFINGYIDIDEFQLLLVDLNNTKSNYWVQLYDDDNNLIDSKSEGTKYNL